MMRVHPWKAWLASLCVLGLFAAGCTPEPQPPPPNPSPTATRLAFAAAPQGGTAGAALAALEVTLRDDQGNTVAGASASVRLTLGSGPSGASLRGTTTVQATNGVARFTDLVLEKAGRYTLSASADNLQGAISAAFDVAPAAAASLALAQLPDSVAAGSAASVEVTALDGFGNVATQYTGTVGFSSSDTQATLPADYTFTAQDAGRRTFANAITLRQAGSRQVTATDRANASLSASRQVTVLPASASRLTFTRQPASRSVRAALPSVEVTIVDAQGNTVNTNTPTITLALTQTGATLEGSLSAAPTAGVASFTSLSLAQEGTGYILTASASGLASATSAPFDIIDDVAPAQPGLSAGTVTDTQIAVQWTAVGDDGSLGTASAYDLRYSTTAITSESDFNAATRATTSAPRAPGSAEQVLLSGLQPGTSYYIALKVTDSVGNSTRSATLQVSTQSPPALRLAFTQQPQSGTAGTALPALAVSIQNASGSTQPVDGTQITLTLQGATGFGPFTASTSNGVATFNDVRIDRAGTGYTLTASATGLTSAISQAFDIAPTSTARLAMSAPSSSYTSGATIPLTVSAEDPYGNVTPSYRGTIIFSTTDSNGDVPVDHAFTEQDAGRRTFNIILRTAGQQTLGVTDLMNGSLGGNIRLTITAP